MDEQYTLEEFGQMIKEKYPDYMDIDNIELANKILEKYPDYQGMIVKKKDEEVSEAPFQPEFEPASEAAFLAFTPTSAQADTDLGSPLQRDSSDFLTSDEQEWMKGYEALQNIEQPKFFDPLTGVELSAAIPPQLRTEEQRAEIAAIEKERVDEEQRKMDEEISNQRSRNLFMNPLNNTVANAVENTFANIRNGITSKTILRMDLMGQGSGYEFEQIQNALEEAKADQERQKVAQKVLLGVSEEGANKGIWGNFSEGNVKDGFLNLFVDGVYAAADAPRTMLPFLAGPVVGGTMTGLNVMADEFADLRSDPTLTREEVAARAMVYGTVEGVISGASANIGLGLGKVATDLSKKIFKEGAEEAINIVKSKGVEFAKTTLGEGLEESLVSYSTQFYDQIMDYGFGKTDEFSFESFKENFSVNEVLDAFTLGVFASAGPGSAHIASLPSSKTVGHSTVAEDKKALDAELRQLKNDYDNESNPDIKKAKRQVLDDKLKAFDALAGLEAEAYSTLNDEEANQVASINRRIADLDIQISKGKDWAGIEYNANQIAEKQKEREKLFEIKKQIEADAYSRAYAEDQKGQLPLFVEDAEGNQVESKTKSTPKAVVEQHKAMETEEATEAEQALFELDTDALAKDRSSSINYVVVELGDISTESLSKKEVPTELHKPIMNMASSFSNALNQNGVKVVYHSTADSYAREVHGLDSAEQMLQKGNDASFGYFDGESIHLYDYRSLDWEGAGYKADNIIDTTRHEFTHAALKSIIGQDADSRTSLFNEMNSIAETNKKVKAVLDNVASRYKDAEQATLEEEAVVALLVDYAANPNKYKSVARRIVDAINNLFVNYTENVITDETDLMNLARKFEVAARIGKKTDVKTKQETQQKAKRESKPFTYLQDTEVFYSFVPQATMGDLGYTTWGKKNFGGVRETRSIKVNDYNHYRNWYNKMTGNGRINSVVDMYQIVDGKKRKINPPKQKLNKDGSVAWIDTPKTSRQRAFEELQRKQKESIERAREAIELRNVAYNILNEAGIDPAYVHVDSFVPRDVDATVDFNRQPKTPEMYEAAIRNIQALIESGFDYKNHEGKVFMRDKNLEMYTMAEGDYQTAQEEIDQDLTRPDDDGSPKHIGTKRFSVPAEVKSIKITEKNQSKVNELGFTLVDAKELEGKVVLYMGYDKTMHNEFGPTIIGDKFRVDMSSGVNSKGFLSSVKEDKGKALAKKLNNAAEQARDLGQKEIYIAYIAQGEENILGNVQAFSATTDFLFDHFKEVVGYSNAEVNDNNVKRLKNFLDREEGPVKYINGSKGLNGKYTEPGVKNALKEGLLGFMKASNNQQYKDYLEKYDLNSDELISENENSIVCEDIVDYDVLKAAIKEFVADPDASNYLKNMKSEYPKAKYLQSMFDFRIALGNAFTSTKTGGLFAGSRLPENLSSKDIKSSFVNPMFSSFKSGEVMAFQKIILEEGKDFDFTRISDKPIAKEQYVGITEAKSRVGTNPFPISLTYETFKESDTESLLIPRRRYHYYDLNSDELISEYDKKAIMDMKLFRAKKEIIDALGQRLRGGKVSVASVGPQYSMLRRAVIKDALSSDTAVSNESQINTGKFSKPSFIEAIDDSGNSWSIRTRTSIQGWKDKWLVRLQDKYRMVFLLQEDVESFRGKTVEEREDFKLAEETMYGKAAYDLKLLDGKLEQITSFLKSNKVTVDELSEYMYALHAGERNAVIEERTEGEVKNGSGISTEEANQIIEGISDDKKSVLDELVSMVREIQQNTRDTMVEFGLETQETIDAFEAMFKNYIPLSGLALDEESSVTSSYPTGGAGLSVFGDQTKRAKGRKSRAENVLAQAIAQNAAVHIEARKNEAMTSLYNLVKNNPNPNVWQVVEEAKTLDPHSVGVRINGEQKYIRFKDASYAATLKNMNAPQTNHFIRLLRMPSNWLRAAFTTQNPEFLIGNFSRDIQSAVFNAAAESEIEGGFLNGERAVRELFSNIGPSLKTLLRDATGREAKADPVVMKYYEEFQQDGGKTGWAYMKPLDELAMSLEKDSQGKSRTQEILGKGKNIFDFVEGVNDAFENSIRLSAYISARENGVSRAKAAQFAKNITVNFNKHGEWGQTLNAVYLFFNASVQGTARLGRSLTGLKPPVRPDGSERRWYERATTAQKMAGGLTVFSGMLTMLGMAMSDEDDDGELYWTKIPDYIKERNLIIMRPDGKNYWKIPMPYGYNVFANMGTSAVEAAAGTRGIADASMFVASSFINSFSPISFGESKDLSTKAVKSVTPTVIKPFIDMATNETYFGTPVYAEPFDESVPSSSMSFRSPEAVKSFFSWINEATGGSQEVPGYVDMNPDQLWYAVEYFMGGPGLFVERTAKTVRRLNAKVINKQDIDLNFNDVPMLRIIYGEPSKYYDMEKYSDRKMMLKGLKNELKRTRDFQNPRYQGVIALDKAIKQTEKELKQVRALRKKARNIKDFGERTVEIQRLMDIERKLIMRFNRYYNEFRED